MLFKYFSLIEYFLFTNKTAVSGNLEALKLNIFLARRQPWWRIRPPNIRNVPMPLLLPVLRMFCVCIFISI